MNHIELLQQLNNLISRINDPLTVVIPTSDGLGGPCVEITGISIGFDWYSNKLLINTKTPLSTIDPSKYSALRILYLKKVSNYDKIVNGQTVEAKYKKEKFTGKNKYECLIWLSKMVENEL